MRTILVDQIAAVNYKYTESLANALSDKNIDVTVITDDYSIKGLHTSQVKLFNTDNKNVSKLAKLKNYVYSYKKILSIVKEKKIDVVHFQWFACTPIDFIYIKKIKNCNTKIVVTAHDILPFAAKNYDKKYLEKIYEIADVVIVQAEANVNRFKELFPKLGFKVKMIPHGHFLDYANIKNKEETRENLGIKENTFVYLFFGQIKTVKGVDVLLKAYSQVVKECPNTILILAGKVWEDSFEKYQSIIDQENLNNNVIKDLSFVPEDKVADYYSACDICVQPYRDVYQSGVVQLTYAYKKPSIVSDLQPFLEVVKNDVTGYVFKNEDPTDLANTMKKAYKERNKLQSMGEAGYNYIKEKFSWDRISDRIINECYK